MNESNAYAEKAIYEVFIEAPVEKVWSELVKTDEALPFFFGSVCKTTGQLKVGSPMAMETTNGKYRSVVGKVLEFDPPIAIHIRLNSQATMIRPAW